MHKTLDRYLKWTYICNIDKVNRNYFIKEKRLLRIVPKYRLGIGSVKR